MNGQPETPLHVTSITAEEPCQKQVAALDATDLEMAFVAVKYYLRDHELRRKTPNLAAYRLAHRLEEILAAGTDPTPAPQQWLTTRDITEHLGCPERTARRIATKHGTKVGRQWLTPADSIPTKEKPQ